MVADTRSTGIGGVGRLPPQPTELIGRRRDVEAVVARLLRDDVRLLTLSGSPGVGKTRLAIAAVEEAAGAFPGGVFFVDLTRLADHTLLPSAIVSVFGLQEIANRAPAEIVGEAVADRCVLLVLDNFEHLLAAAQFISDLLAACPGLKVLVTSRAALQLRWEHVQPLAPLEPQAAFELFVRRAQAVKPEFSLAGDNKDAVAEICRRLDGLPLAIELAAARVRLLSPPEMLSRMRPALPLLTGGPRDQPARHQTMRAALAWSYALLGPAEQALLRRLATFAGAFSLEAVRAVCADEDVDEFFVLDLLGRLVGLSLVVELPAESGEARLRLLEVVRELGAEQLGGEGEAEATALRFTAFFSTLVEAAAPHLTGPDQRQWLERLDAERENLTAAVEAALRTGREVTALEIVAALGQFWFVRGHYTDGRWLLGRVLRRSRGVRSAARAHALNQAGLLAWCQGDLAGSRASHQEALALFGELGDRGGSAAALDHLGVCDETEGDLVAAIGHHREALAIRREIGDVAGQSLSLNNLAVAIANQGDNATARRLFEESLALRRQLGDVRSIAQSLLNLSVVTESLGEAMTARSLLEENLALRRELGDRRGVVISLHNLSAGYRRAGELDRAESLARESLALARELGLNGTIHYILTQLGFIATRRGNLPAAHAYHAEALTMRQAEGNRRTMAESLEWLAALAASAGDLERCARLEGAVGSLRESLGTSVWTGDNDGDRRPIDEAHRALGEREWQAAYAAGAGLAIDEAIVLARAPLPAPAVAATAAVTRSGSRSSLPGGLTEREVEVLQLVAGGKTNREIARTLVLSVATVQNHLMHIYRKLDAAGRAEAAAFAVHHGLVSPPAASG